MTSAEPVSFVLVSTNAPPDPVQVIKAATQLGVGLAHEMGDPDTLNFRIETGGILIVALLLLSVVLVVVLVLVANGTIGGAPKTENEPKAALSSPASASNVSWAIG